MEICNNSEKREEFNQQVTAKKIKNTNRPITKFVYAQGFEEYASPITTAYSNVGENLSTASLSKLPAEIELCKQSIETIPNATPTSVLDSFSSQDTSLTESKSLAQAKSLKSFYPLSKEQVDKLNQLSSRELSNNFANQLLLKLYICDPNKTFASKNHMISYMSKVFRYEKHQAPMVNHETFRFTGNISDPESVEMRQKEKYLSEVEYSIDTSYCSQLKKKISGIFETKPAYRLLTEGEFDYHATNYQTTSLFSSFTSIEVLLILI